MAAPMSSCVSRGYVSRSSASVAPSPSFRRTSSTVTRVPRITGFPAPAYPSSRSFRETPSHGQALLHVAAGGELLQPAAARLDTPDGQRDRGHEERDGRGQG